MAKSMCVNVLASPKVFLKDYARCRYQKYHTFLYHTLAAQFLKKKNLIILDCQQYFQSFRMNKFFKLTFVLFLRLIIFSMAVTQTHV